MSNRISGLGRIRLELAYLGVKASYLRWRSALKAGFDPNQLRVPAGNPDGGQWTGTDAGRGASESAHETIHRDETGEEAWHAVVTTRRSDGSIAKETILNRDGSAIRSEFPASPDEAGFDERHTVMAPDGTTVTFQNAGETQTIFGPDGQLLSANGWTPSGPEPVATVQPAFFPGAAVAVEEAAAATIELGLTLYTWYLSRRQRDQQPVVAFKARDYQPAGQSAGAELAYVGTLTREETEKACPRQVDAQHFTNEATTGISPSDYETPQKYGTAVHVRVRDIVNGPNRQETDYGELGSIRVDILENTKYNTVCVYDIKTGKSGLSAARFAEISRTVHLRFPNTLRIIVIEIRPGR